MLSTITLGGNTVSVVALPSSPGLRSVEFSMSDAVAVVSSPFTGQTQAQQWPGADMWTGTMTLPPLTQDQADEWISFLMQLRGMANAFQIGDPMKTKPKGVVRGAPVVDMAGATSNIAGSQALSIKGLTPGSFRNLLPGDYFQLGYRLHRNLDPVNADSSGKAVMQVWPSLRELPTDGEALVLRNPVGLFRLGDNKRTWSADFTRVSQLSFQIQEYR